MNTMAASPNAGVPASVPTQPNVPTQANARRIEDGGRARASGAARTRLGGSSCATAGVLVGRPDLSDEVVLQAIAERMTFEGRDASKARAVLDAALAGRPVACAFMRRLVLPPPQSSLQMPIQAILREPAPTGEAKGSWLSRLSFGR